MKIIYHPISEILMAFLMGLSCCCLAAQEAEEKVWHWTDAKHAEKTLVLDTTVDSKIVSTVKFPVCRVTRTEVKTETKQRIVGYHFLLKKLSGRNFICNISSGNVEGNIWEAGMDKTDIILGISWVINNCVVLNTIHIAVVDKEDVYSQGLGVQTKSYWLK